MSRDIREKAIGLVFARFFQSRFCEILCQFPRYFILWNGRNSLPPRDVHSTIVPNGRTQSEYGLWPSCAEWLCLKQRKLWFTFPYTRDFGLVVLFRSKSLPGSRPLERSVFVDAQRSHPRETISFPRAASAPSFPGNRALFRFRPALSLYFLKYFELANLSTPSARYFLSPVLLALNTDGDDNDEGAIPST
jgi:hypothetical protein